MNAIGIIVVALVAWAVYRLTFVRRQVKWRRTKPGQEWKLAKARLPGWVTSVEMLIWGPFWLAFVLVTQALLDAGFLRLHPELREVDGFASGLVIVACTFGWIAPALLFCNAVSWLVPPLRKANRAAMVGLETVSYVSASLGLVKFAAVMIPIAAALAALGVWAPWVK